MRYMGSKSRLAYDICTEINNIALNENITEYYEPFVGGGSIIENVNIQNRYGSDLNKYLIALYKKLQEPEMFEYPALTREKWNHIRSNKDKYEDWLVAYAGLFCSFNGKWFTAWGGDYFDKDDKYHNQQAGGYRSLCNESMLLKNIQFNNCSYKDITKPHHSIIYCDAPYIGTTQYDGAEEKFNFDEYYTWLEEMAKDNFILISEYRMPADKFKSIRTFEISSGFGRNFTGDKNIDQITAIEQLFVVKGGWLVDKYYSNNTDDYDF